MLAALLTRFIARVSQNAHAHIVSQWLFPLLKNNNNNNSNNKSKSLILRRNLPSHFLALLAVDLL